MPGIIWMRQDTHTHTTKCRLNQHLYCCLPGMHSSRDFRWALSMRWAWAAPGIFYRACVGWVKQMQVECSAVAGCPSNNPAKWKIWAWKTARDVAEECWSQGAQWLSAQPILLKCPGDLVLTHFRPPGKPLPPQERSHFPGSPWALPSLDTPHYADCGGGRKKSILHLQWMKKRLISDLQLLEEMLQVQNGKPWAKSAAEAQHLAVFPIRTCRAHFAVARAQGAVASINKVSIPG